MTPLVGALWLITRSFEVFPADHPGAYRCTGIGKGHDPATCEDRGKHPSVRFSRVHTRDERQAYRWFGEQLQNVAVAVGACRSPDGGRLLVVDSDRPGAIEDTAVAIGEQHAPTMRVRTAKGHHDYYWLPPDVQLGNGLGALRGKFDGDVRAGNAYVIGPGSVHATGVIYELDDDRPPAPAPHWLLDALQAHAQSQQAPQQSDADRFLMGGGARGGGRLLALVRFVLESHAGDRNNRLYWAACRAFERSGDQAHAVARALRDAAVQVGLGESEARQTITSACRSRNAR